MTTIVEPETETEQPERDAASRGYIKIKTVHGVPIYTDPKEGQWWAKFSQGSGIKWFDRPTLTHLELLIAQHVLDFSGHVEAATAPDAPLHTYDIDSLVKRLDPDGRDYSKIYQRRPVFAFTGVQRVERKSGGTTVVFRLADGSTTSVEREYVRPNPVLDANFYGLAQAYLENLREWQARFEAVIAQYEVITSQEIVSELRKQGARVGRA